MTTNEAIANTIRDQITPGVLASLGAHQFLHGTMTAITESGPSFSFKARILPLTKTDKRSTSPRIMRVIITHTDADLYDVRVTYPRPGDTFMLEDPIVHYEARGLYGDQLARIMLALDYDGPEVLNPRML